MDTKALSACLVVSIFGLSVVMGSVTVARPAQNAKATHPIEYHIGGPASMVNDGSLEYFKAHGFSVFHLVVRDQGTYQAELAKIKSLGMKPVLDIEVPIWDAGRFSGNPITGYASYFQSLKAAGWEYVASEGGRNGDVAYIAQFFKGYVNYNCDQCGLWHTSTGYLFHTQPGTVVNSWESYYPQEWPAIQQGAKEAAALGKENGILAGVWGGGANPILQNSLTGGSPNYKEMLDWSYANGCGFTHFHVWCSISPNGLAQYKQLGFEQVVAQLQQSYPAKSAVAPPKTPTTLSITNRPPSVIINQPYSVTGQLTANGAGVPSAKVTLWRSTDNKAWVSTGTRTTNSAGWYTATDIDSAVSTSYFAAMYAGNGTLASATSYPAIVTVKHPTTLHASASPTAAVGKTILLTGTLTSMKTPLKSQTVMLQRSLDNKVWSAVAGHASTTNASGKYQLSTKEAAAGTYYYRVRYGGTSTYNAPVSNVVKAVVR